MGVHTQDRIRLYQGGRCGGECHVNVTNTPSLTQAVELSVLPPDQQREAAAQVRAAKSTRRGGALTRRPVLCCAKGPRVVAPGVVMEGERVYHQLRMAVITSLEARIASAPQPAREPLQLALGAAKWWQIARCRALLTTVGQPGGASAELAWAIEALADGRAEDVARVLLETAEGEEAARLRAALGA